MIVMNLLNTVCRYANMDYCFASLIRHHNSQLQKVVSYDIVCQWPKSVIERVKHLPPLVHFHLARDMICFAVPKLHIHSHTKHCQENYSLNYLPGVGRTDGEGIERPWANIGATATSTRVMGPGAHIETLNNHWSHWNWQKVIGLSMYSFYPSSYPLTRSIGSLLPRRLSLALSERSVQQDSFDIFSSQQGDQVERWKAMVLMYEADNTKLNPYQVPTTGTSVGLCLNGTNLE